MSDNNIVNPNAEGQESAPVAQTETTAATTATTNAPDAPEATAASTVENTVPVQAPVEERIVTAHDDFDWSVDKRNVAAYSQAEKEKYDKVYENTFVQLNDGE